MSSEPGYEKIELDLSTIPTVEDGIASAGERYRGFIAIASEAFGPGPDHPFFREHFTLMSLINRASSLHRGVVSAVRDENPHAAFTLLRAYLELVVTGLYLDAHPEYVEVLERPMSGLPPGARKRWDELFKFAASELVGVRTVYARLNEMAHFGSAALWHPFTIVDSDEGGSQLSFFTGPRWRDPGDARVALAMLRENDQAMAEVLLRYDSHHVTPLVLRYVERERIRRALAAAGATPATDGQAVGTVPPDVGLAAVSAALVAWCEEHQAFELAEDITADDVEAWVAARRIDAQPEPG